MQVRMGRRKRGREKLNSWALETGVVEGLMARRPLPLQRQSQYFHWEVPASPRQQDEQGCIIARLSPVLRAPATSAGLTTVGWPLARLVVQSKLGGGTNFLLSLVPGSRWGRWM